MHTRDPRELNKKSLQKLEDGLHLKDTLAPDGICEFPMPLSAFPTCTQFKGQKVEALLAKMSEGRTWC